MLYDRLYRELHQVNKLPLVTVSVSFNFISCTVQSCILRIILSLNTRCLGFDFRALPKNKVRSLVFTGPTQLHEDNECGSFDVSNDQMRHYQKRFWNIKKILVLLWYPLTNCGADSSTAQINSYIQLKDYSVVEWALRCDKGDLRSNPCGVGIFWD